MRTPTPRQRKLAAKIGATLTAALSVTACSNLNMRPAQIVEVSGYSVTVNVSTNEPDTWSAFGTTLADRVNLTPAYYSRNITAIEVASGCKVRPELTMHTTPTTVAVVQCKAG